MVNRALSAIRRRMVVKVFLGLVWAVGAALVLLAYSNGQAEIRSLRKTAEDSAQQLAEVVASSVEHSMLQGNGIAVKEMVQAFQGRVPEARIHVFDPFGVEAFGDKPSPPDRATLPAPLRTVLATRERLVEPGGRVWRPVPNEERCRTCHEGTGPLRGVLVLRPAPAWSAPGPAPGAAGVALPAEVRERTLARVVHAGFIHVMTARQAARLDDYFGELPRRAPGLRAAAVYDSNLAVRFGRAPEGLPRTTVAGALVPGAVPQLVSLPSGPAVLVPLPSERRCQQCHVDGKPVRGVLAVAFTPAGPGPAVAEELEATVDASLRAIMMSSLGRMIHAFLREVVETGAVEEAALHDDAGRLFFTSRPPEPPEDVRLPLKTGRTRVVFSDEGGDERVLVAQPLQNGPDCARCHGPAPRLRGVVSVSVPTSAGAARAESIRRTVLFTLGALVLTLAALTTILQALVLRPVNEIGSAAEAVSRGDLSVEVASARTDGDEIQRLGSRINEMVVGLRTKDFLKRYVSKATAEAAHGAARHAHVAPVAAAGERRPMAVLFSDIRGFTAFSEKVAPEAVVELVNRFLGAQASVVEELGGDVDKFVGDELMAVFEGPGAAERAVACGLALVESVDAARRGDGEPRIGVGISQGTVIAGSIGSAERMDFTVMGDVVNTGARIVGAAGAGEVLVSEAVERAAAGTAGLAFEPLPPLSVKGKQEPLSVFRARRA